jgi:hypothetical protein
MNEILSCKLVEKTHYGAIKIESSNIDSFVDQYRNALEVTKGITGVAYTFGTEGLIPRLKGQSNIIYIGETKHDVWSRYNVKNDTNMYWDVYSHIIQSFGAITINVSANHKVTERTFLNQYFRAHNELPPINRKG